MSKINSIFMSKINYQFIKLTNLTSLYNFMIIISNHQPTNSTNIILMILNIPLTKNVTRQCC